MNNAIASGNGADMYVIRDMDMGRKYASKGVFLDLNTFLEQDPEIHSENYYENILKMYSYDGLCYAVFPRFIIQSYVGRQSVLGDRTSWTPQDVMELIQEYPDKVFSPYIQKQGLLSMLVCNDLDHYIDWETGKCSFDTQEFMDVLKFVNEAVPDAEGSEYSEEEDMLYYNNKALVTDAYLYSLQEIQLYMNENTLEINSGTLTLASDVSISGSTANALVLLSGGNLVLQGISTNANTMIYNTGVGAAIKSTAGTVTWNDTGLAVTNPNGVHLAIEGASVSGEMVTIPKWVIVKSGCVPIWDSTGRKITLKSVQSEFTNGTVTAA